MIFTSSWSPLHCSWGDIFSLSLKFLNSILTSIKNFTGLWNTTLSNSPFKIGQQLPAELGLKTSTFEFDAKYVSFSIYKILPVVRNVLFAVLLTPMAFAYFGITSISCGAWYTMISQRRLLLMPFVWMQTFGFLCHLVLKFGKVSNGRDKLKSKENQINPESF